MTVFNENGISSLVDVDSDQDAGYSSVDEIGSHGFTSLQSQSLCIVDARVLNVACAGPVAVEV